MIGLLRDVVAEFTTEAVEGREHLSEPIAKVVWRFEEAGLEFDAGGAATTVLGELTNAPDCIAVCPEPLCQAQGRVRSTLHLDVRQDGQPGSIQRQSDKVKEQIADPEMA